MSASSQNVSYGGVPVRFRLDSPLFLCFDPLALDSLRGLIGNKDGVDLGWLLERANSNSLEVSCGRVDDFRPGTFSLDPRDIRRFGDEEDGFEYVGGDRAEMESSVIWESYPFVGVDSGAIMIVDAVHLRQFVMFLSWERYDESLGDDSVFAALVDELGGPFFALISAYSEPGFEFDGDGSYCIPAGSVRPYSD